MQYEYETPDYGSKRGPAWYHDQLAPVMLEGEIRSVILLVTDITERRQMEKALRESEERLRMLFEGTHDLIALVDAEAKPLWVNRAWKRIFGPDIETVKIPFTQIHPDDLEKVTGAWETLISENREIKNLHYRHRPRSGDYLPLETSVHPVISGDETQYYLISHDITANERVKDDLQQRLEFERLISAIRADFVGRTGEDIDEGINKALENVAAFLGADLASVFLFHDNLTKITNTYEWCADPGDSQIAQVQAIPVEAYSYYFRLLH